MTGIKPKAWIADAADRVESDALTLAAGKKVELVKGMRLTVRTDQGGRFVGIVERFERDGNVAVIMPVREPVRDVFPTGYTLVRAHWNGAHVEEIAE